MDLFKSGCQCLDSRKRPGIKHGILCLKENDDTVIGAGEILAKLTQVHFGQFHIVLKKIDGHWKITQDWDTSTIAGKPITAEVFESREPAVF